MASTNDTHPSIYRTLCRMLIQVTRLPDRSRYLNLPPIHNFDWDSIPAFYRKPVLALCRMVLERSRYISARQGADEAAADSLRDDCRIGVVVALKLMDGLGCPNIASDEGIFFTGDSWMDPGEPIPRQKLEEIFAEFKGTVVVPNGGKDPNQTSFRFLKTWRAGHQSARDVLARLKQQATEEISQSL